MKYFVLTIAILLTVSNFANAQKKTDIRKIDFRNYTHVIGKESVKFEDGVQIGRCQKDADGIASDDVWSLNEIRYGDLDGDGEDEAFMSLIANICDGNMITNEAVLVYKFMSGKVVKLPEFQYFDAGCEPNKECDFSRSPGVSVEYDKALKQVIVGQSYSTEDDAMCCPSLERRTWFKWNGAKFVEIKKSKIELVKTN